MCSAEASGFSHQPLEDGVRHVLLGLQVRLPGTHGAVQVTLRRRLHDVFHRESGQPCFSAQVAPEQSRAIQPAHGRASLIVAVLRGRASVIYERWIACLGMGAETARKSACATMTMEDRVRRLNGSPFRENAEYVLYWAQMNRRTEYNHALAYAISLANERKLPVLFYEGLTCTYPYANDRLHTFLLEGVPDTAAALKKLGIGYIFYLRRRRRDPDDVLYQLAARAAAVVTDDYPTFIARRHNAASPGQTRRPLLRRRFQLRGSHEPDGEARVRGLYDPAEDPETARRVSTAVRYAAGVQAVRRPGSRVSHRCDRSGPAGSGMRDRSSVKPSITHRGGSRQAQRVLAALPREEPPALRAREE